MPGLASGFVFRSCTNLDDLLRGLALGFMYFAAAAGWVQPKRNVIPLRFGLTWPSYVAEECLKS